jgi:hypothetical protein
MNSFDRIQTRLDSAFPQFSDCFSIDTRSEFEIIDYEGQSYLIDEDATILVQTKEGNTIIDDFDRDKTFKVSNAKTVGFIPIDGKKGLLGYGDSYCDCVFFDANDFCFIEFKLNATSLEERAVRKIRKKAIKQLSNTIAFLNEKIELIDANLLNVEAYICTPEAYPRGNTAFKALQVAFSEDNFGIELFETDEKICR